VAVRIELFTIAGTVDFELVDPAVLAAAVGAFDAGTDPGEAAGAVRCVGWLSASDDDEERFADWCAEVDDDLGVGLLHQGIDEGVGLASTSVASPGAAAAPVPAVPGDGAWESAWADTLRGALAAADGGRIGWRTNFDVSGTSGTPDDYPTASRSISA
jgi:hypothetical protein